MSRPPVLLVGREASFHLLIIHFRFVSDCTDPAAAGHNSSWSGHPDRPRDRCLRVCVPFSGSVTLFPKQPAAGCRPKPDSILAWSRIARFPAVWFN